MKAILHPSSSTCKQSLQVAVLALLLCGCTGRQNPGSYEGGKSDSWTGHKPAPWPTNAAVVPMLPPVPVQSTIKLTVARTVSYDEMAPVSYKPMPVVITPKLPPCPPLHWEATPGWGGIVISGPVLELLDWNHTGCPQFPSVCTARAWLTETTDYVLPVQTSGQEFARIIPFETE